MSEQNETWNTCPQCRKRWKDESATPGVVHRTKICGVECERAYRRDIALMQPEDLDE